MCRSFPWLTLPADPVISGVPKCTAPPVASTAVPLGLLSAAAVGEPPSATPDPPPAIKVTEPLAVTWFTNCEPAMYVALPSPFTREARRPRCRWRATRLRVSTRPLCEADSCPNPRCIGCRRYREPRRSVISTVRRWPRAPSPLYAYVPSPATVVIYAASAIDSANCVGCRLSAKKRFPAASTASPCGVLIIALAAGPPSPP